MSSDHNPPLIPRLGGSPAISAQLLQRPSPAENTEPPCPPNDGVANPQPPPLPVNEATNIAVHNPVNNRSDVAAPSFLENVIVSS